MKALTMIACAFAVSALGQDAAQLAPSDSRLSYTDCFKVEFVKLADGAEAARFARPGASQAGYQFDNPGARFRFQTDAARCVVKLRYSELHVSTSARNSVGAAMIDGKIVSSFATKQKGVKRSVEEVDVALSSPSAGFHLYELVMPYGDSVDILGVSAPEGSKFETPAPRPKLRCAFYGDSVAHGFTASSIVKTYAFLLSERDGFQMVNLGIGGRGSSAADGALAASAKCDIAHVHIGTNDWQGGLPPAATKRNILGFIKGFRASQPDAPIYFDTSLWVGEAWKPASAKFPLEDYRKAIRDAVAESGDKRSFIIEGMDLIDRDVKFFDPCLVHPNDAGLAQMAERLSGNIKSAERN